MSTNEYQVIELSDSDSERISNDIRSSFLFDGIFFTVTVIPLCIILLAVVAIFGYPYEEGFKAKVYQSTVNVLIGFIVFFIALFLSGIVNALLKFFDLKSKKKKRIQTKEYKLFESKNGFTLSITKPVKLKLDIYAELANLINPKDQLIIDLCIKSRYLLLVSQNNKNLLEIIEHEEDRKYPLEDD